MFLAFLLLVAGIAIGVGVSVLWRRLGLGSSGRQGATRPWRVIAVPIVNDILPEAALASAAQLGVATHADVVPLVAVQVPRAMSLDCESPPGLAAALSRLEAAEAVVRRLGAEAHGEIVRVREMGDLAGRACEDTGAQVVVLEYNPSSRTTADLARTFIDAKLSCRFDLMLAQTGVHPHGSSA